MANERDPFTDTTTAASITLSPTSNGSLNLPTQSAQSKRPGLNRRGTDSQLHQRSSSSRNPRHGNGQAHSVHAHAHAYPTVGGGSSSSRLHARVPSSSKKLNRRQPSSPSPEPSITQYPHHHRRATSEVKLPRQTSSATILKKNSSHSNLGLAGKRNRSQADIIKRPKASATNLKRSSSHKDVNKLKGNKTSVHFDLGEDKDIDDIDIGDDDDAHEDEWVDASNSASPYLSRRGSVVSSTGPASTGGEETGGGGDGNEDDDDNDDDDNDDNDEEEDDHIGSPSSQPHTPPQHLPIDRKTAQHKEYITSRLLQRIPSSSAPPKMSAETATVPPNTSSPESRRGPPSLYGTPKNSALVGSGGDELTSRFVNGSGQSVEPGSFSTSLRSPIHPTESMRRPRSMGNLEQEHRNSISEDEGDSALAPRTRRPVYRAQPAEKSRTQQKLNLQRASSSIEPTQAGGTVGVSGVSPLVGGSSYDNRDPRIGKLLERTGMEYLVVRRYQNPIARSISRLSRMPASQKHRRIPHQNGINGAVHSSRPSDIGGSNHYGFGQSLGDSSKSRPTTPRRTTSIRTNGAGSSFDAQDERVHDRLSGSSYVNGDDDGVAALLRNLWDKSMDFSASQD
ncbi:hypothetical protein MGN70_001429 [Eutypa lata]|nr:hypothetical protein MGN70_001429 [Eutypa lata]